MSVLEGKEASENATRQPLKNISMASDWTQTAFNRSESFTVRDLVDDSPTAGCVWPQSVLALAIDELLIAKDPVIVRKTKIVLKDSKNASVWNKIPQECRNIGVLYAALKGCDAMLKYFLELGGDANSTDSMRRRALHYAASWPGAEAAVCIDLLIKHGAVVDTWDVNDEATPLCCAAASGCIESVESLLKAGADVNAKVNTSPLVLDVRSGTSACVTPPVAAGAVVNSKQHNSKSPLHLAAAHGNADCLKLLLVSNAATHAVCGIDGWNPLHVAARNGQVACIRLLLQASKDEIDKQDTNGLTPLHLAALCQSAESVAELLENGARHNIFDHMKETPLHSAAFKCRQSLDVVELLISKGANVDAQNKNGQTPLHFAAINGNSQLAAFLIESGADLFIQSRDGKTALEYVERLVPNALQAIKRNLDWEVKITSYDKIKLEYELQLKLSKLVPSGNQQNAGEMAKLNSLIAANRHVLLHPVVGAFLHLKWKKMWFFFFLSLTFQFCYVLSLSLNIHSMYVINDNGTDCSVNSDSWFCEPEGQVLTDAVWYLTVVLGSATFSKELFQLFFNPKDPENYARIFSVVGMFLTLRHSNQKEAGEDHSDWQHHLAAVVIIASWCNLMMLVGRFPTFGLYVQIFTTVAWNIAKLLLAYMSLIVGFAMGLAVLFPHSKSLSRMPEALLKATVMMTGEIGYDEMFDESDAHVQYVGTTHLIFLAFVVLVVIVLMNLVVGLAVSDIQDLQKSADLDRLERLTKQIARMEIFVLFPMKWEERLKCECLRRKVLVVSPKAKRTYNFKPNDPRDHCFPPDIKKGLFAIAINNKVNTEENNQQPVSPPESR